MLFLFFAPSVMVASLFSASLARCARLFDRSHSRHLSHVLYLTGVGMGRRHRGLEHFLGEFGGDIRILRVELELQCEVRVQ